MCKRRPLTSLPEAPRACKSFDRVKNWRSLVLRSTGLSRWSRRWGRFTPAIWRWSRRRRPRPTGSSPASSSTRRSSRPARILPATRGARAKMRVCWRMPAVLCCGCLPSPISIRRALPPRLVCRACRSGGRAKRGRAILMASPPSSPSCCFVRGRMLRSSVSSLPNSFFPAYHFERQSLLTATRSPIGLVFCPIIRREN